MGEYLAALLYRDGEGVEANQETAKTLFATVVNDKRPALVSDDGCGLAVEDEKDRESYRTAAQEELDKIAANENFWHGAATVAAAAVALSVLASYGNSPPSSSPSNASDQQYGGESLEQERERNQELNEDFGQQILNDNEEH
jgi:hypothetical protein